MTFTLAEVLLFIIAGMLTVMVGLLIWLVIRVSKVSGEIEGGWPISVRPLVESTVLSRPSRWGPLWPARCWRPR